MLSVEALERIFDQLASAVDRAGPAHESLMLTKLVLLLAHHVGDEARIEQAIAQALKDLSNP